MVGLVVASPRVLGRDERRLESSVEVEECSKCRSFDFLCEDLCEDLCESFFSDREEDSRFGESLGLSRSLSRVFDGMSGSGADRLSPDFQPEHRG